MRKQVLILTWVVVVTALAGILCGQEWLQYRGDSALTGRASIPGLIKGEPDDGWTFDIAAWEGYVCVDRQETPNQLSLPYHTEVDPGYYGSHEYDWGLGAPRYDLYGTGNLVAIADWYPYKVAKVLPSVTGLQKFVMESWDDFGDNAKGHLYKYDTGSEIEVWSSSAVTGCYGPVVIVVDADNDGQLDIAFSVHYRIIVFDGATGSTKMYFNYHTQRNYGWFGAANIDGDPYPEFCAISDFAQHFEVVDNNGSALSLLWFKQVESETTCNKRVTRPGPFCFLDVDNDGSVEVILNIYNYTNDGKWHLMVYDALTGAVKYDYVDRYLNGIHDLDSDGLMELFVSVTSGLEVPTYAPIRLWNLRPSLPPLERWSHSYGKWHTRELDSLPLTVNTSAADGRRTVVVGDVNDDGRLDFFVSEPGSSDTEICTAYGLNAGGIVESLWSVEGPAAAILQVQAVADIDSDSFNEALLHIRGRGESGESVTGTGAGLELKQWSRSSIQPGTPVVADLDLDGKMEVVVVTGNQEVASIEAPKRWGSLQFAWLNWRVPGQGVTHSADSGHQGVSAADLNGDGTKEVMLAQEASNGQASLLVLNPNGTTHWQTIFPDFDGSPPIWNFGGLTYWAAGNFTSTSHRDVYVTLRHSTSISDWGYLLDGRNGSIIWERESLEWPGLDCRGHGGYPVAAADVDADNLDELIGEYPDRFFVVDGPSGDPDVVKKTSNGGIFGDEWWSYAYPAVMDLFGDSIPEIIWGGCQYGTAMLRPDGSVIWQGTHGDGTNSLQGLGDIDGDSDLEMCGVYSGTFRVYNPETGSIVDSLSGVPDPSWAPAQDVGLVSGDIDNDGRDEFLWGTDDSIVCVEQEGSSLQTAWTKYIGSACGDLALADVNMDGYLEIVVCTADGYVRVYEGEEPPLAARLWSLYE